MTRAGLPPRKRRGGERIRELVTERMIAALERGTILRRNP